jgi:Cu(I)/Ag(I) efflux system membrane protein CusA/SilA
MITHIIKWSIRNRFFVLLATLMIVVAGLYTLKNTPVDAIPDLSDVQVIVKTSYPGQAPEVVEQQVTYPLTSALLSVPGAKTVRGFSFFGDSYIYIIFDDDTDLYWARSRVLEYLSQVSPNLPAAAKPQLGPDATGVGWIYMYALSDPSGKHDLSELRSLQDWFLKYELQTVQGVSEVATVGGMVKQYQVIVDPHKLQAYNIPLSHIQLAIQQGNSETGASVIEMAEAEYMIRTTGYIKRKSDIENIPIGLNSELDGTPLLIKNIADLELGPQMRRGLADLNGEGETVGGIVVMRFGENAQATINRVKSKLASLQGSLPEGVEITPVYDRSNLIERSIDNLSTKLLAELIVVSVICVLFLSHLRSSLVAMLSLPIGILIAFIVMYLQGINANIMSLGGIAIAIGAMVDGAIVLVENMHKHIEKTPITKQNRWEIVAKSASEVGPALFFSLLIVTVSFVPVFTLEAQEGKMFSPLAYTKTYAMAAAAILAITLIPVLMGYFIRGKIKPESKNPINRVLINIYRPVLKLALAFPKSVIVISLFILSSSLWPINRIGSEFMPTLNEGDLMYMPSTYAGVSIGEARDILQQTNKLIKTIPEVVNVFGKVGRADTATDPAPLTMIETFIQLAPNSEWRAGLTTESLIQELDDLVDFPGLTNAWVMPIKTRIDMLSTGIKTPIGIKIGGPDLSVIQEIGQQIESTLSTLDGTASVYAERVVGGRYIVIDIDRRAAAKFGLNIADIQTYISSAVGGQQLTSSVEGLERYPVQVRFPESYRDSPDKLKKLPILSPSGAYIALGEVTNISIVDGPPSIKSENARPNGWVYVDVNNIDIGNYVENAKLLVNNNITLPVGYSLTWSGQYEYIERAEQKLKFVVPLTLMIIIILLYANFRSLPQVAMIMGTMPFALIGGFWLLYLENFNFSVAVAVGFIALAGVAVEIGIIMLTYLDNRISSMNQKNDLLELKQTIIEGSEQRIRPVMMTSLSIILGLLPVMYGSGTGSELMSRIAAPLVGGMISALFLSLIVLPVIYFIWQKSRINKALKQ